MSIDDLYRRVIMEHYKEPRNRGELQAGAVTIETNNPSCGDRILLHLLIKDDFIEQAKFTGEGCSISLASASMMTEAVTGQRFETAIKLIELFTQMMQGQAIDYRSLHPECLAAFSGVTKFPARIKCALLAWEALQKGIR